jgi:hypothetical protein
VRKFLFKGVKVTYKIINAVANILLVLCLFFAIFSIVRMAQKWKEFTTTPMRGAVMSQLEKDLKK